MSFIKNYYLSLISIILITTISIYDFYYYWGGLFVNMAENKNLAIGLLALFAILNFLLVKKSKDQFKGKLFQAMKLLSFIVIFSAILFDNGSSNKAFDTNTVFLDDLEVIKKKPTVEIELSKEFKTYNDISFTFNMAMWKLGAEKLINQKMIKTEPLFECEWKWLSESTLGCRSPKLKPATAYKVTLSAGIESLNGKELEEKVVLKFDTYRPQIKSTMFQFIADAPYFLLTLNQDVDASSIKSKLICPNGTITFNGASLENKQERTYKVLLKEMKQILANRKCKLVVAKNIISQYGSLTSSEDYEYEMLVPKEIRDINREFQVVKVACNGNYLEDEIYGEGIDCLSKSELKIYFNRQIKGSELKKSFFEFSPQPESLEGDFNKLDIVDEKSYRSITFKKKLDTTKSYKLTFKNSLQSIKGEQLVVGEPISLYTYSEPPSFSLRYSMVVREKKGPWRLPYEIKNISSFTLGWKLLKTPEAIADYIYDNYRGYYYNEKYLSNTTDSEIKIPFKINMGEKLPLDLKQVSQSSGLFALHFKKPIVEDQFIEAYEKQILADRERRAKWYSAGHDFGPIKPFDISSRANVLVTDIGMHVKIGFFNTLVWTFSIQDGKPIEGVKVRLYTNRGRYTEAISDENGIVLLEGRSATDYASYDYKFIVVAQKDDDISYLNGNYKFEGGMNTYNFNLKSRNLTNFKNLICQAIPDRPIYKPGDNVSIKLVARKWDNESLTLKGIDVESFDFEIIDSVGEKVHESKVKMNDYGSGIIKFKLKPNAKTGDYRIKIKDRYINSIRGFKVQEFRKSNFEVSVTADKKKYSSEKYINVEVLAQYLFGGGVKETDTKLRATFKEKEFSPEQDDLSTYFKKDYDYHDYYYRSNSTRTILNEDYQTDKNGKINFTIDLDDVSKKHGDITIEASVEDDHGATLSNRTTIKLSKKKDYLGLKLDRWSYDVKDGISPKVILLNHLSQPIKNKKIKIRLIKKNYIVNRRLGTGNYYYYDSKIEREEIDECEVVSKEYPDNCKLNLKDGGSYEVIASYGSEELTRYTYAYGGSGYISWGHNNHDRIDIIPEKKKYEKGDVAKFLIKSPYPKSKVLITIERHGILKKEIIDINSGAYIYELKLDNDTFAPGIFLSAVLLQGRTSEKVEGNLDLGKPSFKIGYAAIDVVDPLKKLKIKIDIAQKEYRPGDTVEAKIKVKDINGDTGNNELLIAVVDQAILQLVSNYQDNYELYSIFYRSPGLDIRNFQTLNALLGRSVYGKKGGTAGGGGGGGLDIRDNFLPIAYWKPDAITDSDGVYKFKFKVPDNLTKWRLIVSAQDKKHRFGNNSDTFIVNKKLMLQPALPNFLTEGDKLNAKFVVYNKYTEQQKVSLEIQSTDFDFSNNDDEKEIESEDKASFFRKMSPKKAGKSKITSIVRSEKFNDAMESIIPIIPLGSDVTDALYVTTDKEVTEKEFVYDSDTSKEARKLNLLFSTSILTGVDESFEYVIRYPYGCWEQRLSKTIYLNQYDTFKPWLSKFSTDIDVKKTVNEIIASAYKYQADNGGMKYYPSQYGNSSSYLSFFTAYAFDLIEQNGFEIDGTVKSSLESYIVNQLSAGSFFSWWNSNSIPAMEAKYLYILKKYFNRNMESKLNKMIANYSDYSLNTQLFLLRTANLYKLDRKIINKLKNAVIGNYNEEPRSVSLVSSVNYYKYFLDTDGKTYCLSLSALLETDSKLEIIPKLVNKISQIRKNGRWYNTQENVFCFEALQNYAKIYEKDIPDFNLEAMVNSKKVGDYKVNERGVNLKDISVPNSLLEEQGKVEVKKKGKGRFYLSLIQKYRSFDVKAGQKNNGFEITKTLYLYKNDNWVELTDKVVELKKGDLVKVLLEVQTNTTRYQVGINDPLAGGLEPVNTALATASQASKALAKPVKDIVDKYDYYSNFYRSNGFTHIDLRLQTAQFYADRLSAGTYQAEYMLQVIASGEFRMNPTVIEEMYYPEINGRTDGRKINIKE